MNAKRVMITGEDLASQLRKHLTHAFEINVVIRLSDPFVSTITRDMMVSAADKVWSVWKENVNDCDKQAMAVVNECHRRAASESMPWAVGFLRAATIKPGPQIRTRPAVDHVYTWFFESAESLVIFDQTNRLWHTPAQLRAVDFVFG